MFKSVKKFVINMIICYMAVILLTGCGQGNSVTEKNLVVLVGNTKNEASINVSAIEDKIKDVCNVCGTITIIQIDGNPYIVEQLKIPERKKGISQTKKEQIIAEQCSQIKALLTQCVPKTEEIDTLKALQMASRALANCTGEKEVILLHSGLSTKGMVDFTQIFLESEQSEKLVSNLIEEQAIPDFKDVNIVWSGLGETVYPQADLYDKNRRNLQADWKAVLEASGADSVNFLSGVALNKNADTNLPFVSEVPIVKPASIWEKQDCEFNLEEIFKYDGDKIQFKPDTDELLTSNSEILLLFSKLIQYMKSNSEYRIMLIGTTASPGDEDGRRELSLKRVAAIKKIFVDSGKVLESQIITVGLGYDNELTVNDTDENGMLVELQAKQNRAVFVTNMESDLAKKFLKY